MDPAWSVIIGSAAASLLVETYLLVKGVRVAPDRKRYAAGSIACGLLFFVPFLCVVGLTLGIIARSSTVYRRTAAAGIVLNGFFCLVYAGLLISRLAS